jgi:NAD(P)-dependent dehydrogenase (short-subunit alcohol dehydrogenase family)
MAAAPEQASKPSGDWSRLLTDKVVFVTGAGGAIGSTIAQTCALHGARVIVADVNKKAADEVVTKIIDEDANKKDYVMAIELDVTSEQAIQNAVQAVVDKWNTIDVLVNNAAMFLFGAVENVSAEAWSQILNVNVRGYALMAKAVVPLLKKQRSGSIIQMASISSWIAQPDFVPYSTTKGAILQMTRNLALDLGSYNIRCNAICPGAILTPATARHAAHLNIPLDKLVEDGVKTQCLKRWGTTQEVANLTVFLASDLCHFATGASFLVDGGLTTI